MTLDEATKFMEAAEERGTPVYVWWAGPQTGFLSTIHPSMIPPGVPYTTFTPEGRRFSYGPG